MDEQQFHDEAATSAHIQYAIKLAHSRLRDFAAKVIASKDSRFTPEQVRDFKTKERDFNRTVYFIQNKWVWQTGGFANLPNGTVLFSYLRRCPSIRNVVSQQKSMDTDSSDRAIETLCHLMKEIGFPEDAQRIRDFLNKPAVIPRQGLEAPKVSWEQLKQKGNDHFREGRYTEAMIAYTQALKENPEASILYSNRALSELKLGRYEDARNDAEDALQLDLQCIKYYRILSEALMKLELAEEALAVCRRGLQLDPRDSVLLVRVRDLNAVMVMRENDKNPRKDPKEVIEGPELSEELLKYLSKCAQLKPDPNDIHVGDTEHWEKYFKLDKVVREGHNCYHGMRGSKKDYLRAFECFKKAADLGSAEGQYNLGLLYSTGHGTNIDYGLMLKYFRLAVSHKPFVSTGVKILPVLGVAEAENSLGNAFRDGRGVDKDLKTAFSHYIKAANWGLSAAQNNAGWCLFFGEGVARNPQFARMWYERAAKQDLAEAQLNYAIMLEAGEGGPRDEHQAFEYFKKAGEQGCPGALEKLQHMSMNGAATATQQEGFRTMVFDKSSKNDVETLHFMGNQCKDKSDYDSAIAFWMKASEKGHMESTIALWEVLLKKKQRNREAFNYCTEASKAGDAQSQLALADLLAKGIGCKRNPDAAWKWFQRAQHHFNLDAKQFEESMSIGKKVCDFEGSHSLPTESLSWPDRFDRYMISEAKLPRAAADSLDELRELGKQPEPLPATFTLSIGKDGKQAVISAAENGSRTAQNVLRARLMIAEAFDAWASQDCDRAFALLRESHRCDDIIKFQNPDMAAYIEGRKLTTPDAMFVRACNFINDIKGSIAYLERSIHLHPMEADLHHLLAACYGFDKRYKESLASAKRAYELEPRPNWLYTIATATRMLCRNADPQKQGKGHRQSSKTDALQAYQKYLEGNPKDDRKVPAALFCMAELYSLNDADVQKVKDYYKWACEADARRLPCFQAVDEWFGPRKIVEIYLNALERNISDSARSNDENDATEQANNRCQECGERIPLYVCVCREAAYCGRECQTSHWQTHKQSCKAKFARMQKLQKLY